MMESSKPLALKVFSVLRSIAPTGLALTLLFSVVYSFLGYEISTSLWWVIGFLVFGSFAYYAFHQKLMIYVLKRIGEAIFVLFIIASSTFLLLRAIPGGPFDRDKALPPEVIANIEAKYNLNAPLYVQYIDYIKGLARGDLGESYKYIGRGVTEIIADALPACIYLSLDNPLLMSMSLPIHEFMSESTGPHRLGRCRRSRYHPGPVPA